ncbi:nuclear transport factor 2 family protein [Nostoc sp. FACHB-87]|uniref:nuclear transport factor 2 family protein n=1 Tax=Nostocales TaxID=1161 RepID=UPI001687B2FF|nr:MULTISPECIES: nuclear transport factor 2 family protein [Nostocales]MBD2300788.1 nuclear transport factor 2 family protein [Nostoc sp. FACHB-190]MBD2455280.1 nuclear transport factor 2 family protein [Nostoc sp. FACHB-87]MBD2476895.1 nuclear transport factor 2 family protein [Anabaena sp. FACHB-83]MBD2489200.1 nuclear transport factor 2 family protein [Aulosira sp. FACHB-615]
MKKGREIQQVASNLMSFFVKRLSLILLAGVMVIFVGGKFDVASASQPNAESEIESLSVCYALGTDAIGRGDLPEGKKIYQKCFTSDAEITAIFPDDTSVTKYGTNAWADFVYSVFQGNGYTATQHLLGTFDIDVKNNTATMSSYLHATHKLSDTSIDVANGTYVDTVVNKNGKWQIKKRVLTLIDFLNLSSPGSPQAQASSAARSSNSDSNTSSDEPHRPNVRDYI